MRSRMDKYQGVEKNKYERSSKNTKLYEEVYDDIYKDTTYKNMEVIDSAKEINLNRLKNMLDDKYDTRQYRTFKNYSVEDVDIDDKPTFINDKKTSYDINDVINEANAEPENIENSSDILDNSFFTSNNELPVSVISSIIKTSFSLISKSIFFIIFTSPLENVSL